MKGTPIQFRLTPDTLAEIDQIREHIAAGSRAEVVRQAIRRWYAEIATPDNGRKIPKKTDKRH